MRDIFPSENDVADALFDLRVACPTVGISIILAKTLEQYPSWILSIKVISYNVSILIIDIQTF